MQYPPTRKVDVVDDYHGVTVADPYRWLENLDSADTAAWVAEQNALTEAYLSQQPIRAQFRARIAELWNYRKAGLPFIEGGRLFYRLSTGLEPQPALVMREHLDSEPVCVIDPNALWPDGTTALAAFAPSPDLRYLAYAFSAGGADWQSVRIRDLATGADLADAVEWMRFSGLAWTHDSRGFFYSRYPEPPAGKALEAALSGHALYYHEVGTAQAHDRLIYTNTEHPAWFVTGKLTEDGRYLLIETSKGADNTNRLLGVDLVDPDGPLLDAPVRPLFDMDGAECLPIGAEGSRLFVRTDLDSPNRRIVSFEIADAMASPDPRVWHAVIAESGHAIETATMAAGRIFIEYLVDVTSRLAMFDVSGARIGDVELPAVGSLVGFTGRQDGPLLFCAFTSPLYPASIFVYDATAGSSRPFEVPDAPVDVSRYETVQHFAISTDGARIPFFVTSAKDMPRDGAAPTVLYGYGGFAVSLTPGYRPDVPAWLERGGVWVTANLRGGAEYGETWHRAGMLDRKQQVFDDCIAVAERLIADGVTRASKLAIMGGSNGGLLVGAVMEQRPDLFAAALPAVGVMDMLRYDRFTGGRAWVTEYGSSSDPAQFAVLFAYSPLHNLVPGTCYPATLIVTADHDDRVVPSHSFKFAAALQEAQGCERPVLIRVETGGSHNFRSTDKRIAELADEWTFLGVQLGL